MRLFGKSNNGRGTQGYASSKSWRKINSEYGTTEVCGLEVGRITSSRGDRGERLENAEVYLINNRDLKLKTNKKERRGMQLEVVWEE